MDDSAFQAVLQNLNGTLSTMQGLLQDTRDRVVRVEAHMEAQTAHRAEVDRKLAQHADAISDLEQNAVRVDAIDGYKRWLVGTVIACAGSVAGLSAAVFYWH